MPAAPLEKVTLPALSATLTARILQSQHVPATPSAFMPSPASTPLTLVPCPRSSLGTASLLTKSYPGITRPTRSGWLDCTPLSTTATTGPLAPVVTFQARSVRTLVAHHSCGQYVSSGVSVRWATPSASTEATFLSLAKALWTAARVRPLAGVTTV